MDIRIEKENNYRGLVSIDDSNLSIKNLILEQRDILDTPLKAKVETLSITPLTRGLTKELFLTC